MFEEFMKELYKKYLDSDWELLTRSELLNCRMKDSETFGKFATRVSSQHSLLIGTPSALDPTRLRHTLKAGMCDDLAYYYVKNKEVAAMPVYKLNAWICAVVRIDEEHVHNIERQKRIAAELHKVKKRKATDDGDRPRKNGTETRVKGSKPNSSMSVASSSSLCPSLPKLTEDEHRLLLENDDRNKCHMFFVGHKSFDCNNDFSEPTKYRTLTQADVTATATTRKDPPS
ncbi:hypothetical protein DFH09DRAFT_1313695 [Mycena vulgaris]|nr:hypothetical protein DFH09DRAFT_1313695 [Mycena vulgaris]